MIDLIEGILSEFAERASRQDAWVMPRDNSTRDYRTEYLRRREKALEYQRAYERAKRLPVGQLELFAS